MLNLFYVFVTYRDEGGGSRSSITDGARFRMRTFHRVGLTSRLSSYNRRLLVDLFVRSIRCVGPRAASRSLVNCVSGVRLAPRFLFIGDSKRGSLVGVFDESKTCVHSLKGLKRKPKRAGAVLNFSTASDLMCMGTTCHDNFFMCQMRSGRFVRGVIPSGSFRTLVDTSTSFSLLGGGVIYCPNFVPRNRFFPRCISAIYVMKTSNAIIAGRDPCLKSYFCTGYPRFIVVSEPQR